MSGRAEIHRIVNGRAIATGRHADRARERSGERSYTAVLTNAARRARRRDIIIIVGFAANKSINQQ